MNNKISTASSGARFSALISRMSAMNAYGSLWLNITSDDLYRAQLFAETGAAELNAANTAIRFTVAGRVFCSTSAVYPVQVLSQ